MVIAKKVILVSVCVTLFTCVTSRIAANICETPGNQDGTCKKASECPSLYNFFLYSAISDEIKDYLRKSVCGYAEDQPKVCCPNGKLNVTIPSLKEKKVAVTLLKHEFLPNDRKCGIYAEDRLFRGEKVAMDQYPWNVLLKYKTQDNRDGFYCAGVPISGSYVLTAAHCINGPNLPENAKLVAVRYGEHNITTDPDCEVWGGLTDCVLPVRDVPIEETIIHEDYNPQDINQYHDIALLRLKYRFLYNDFVQPLCLPAQKKNYTDGTILEGAGWGINGSTMTYSEKKRVQVAVEKRSVCEEALRVKLNRNQLCFATEENKLCSRDSGGSLFDYSINRTTINAYAAAVMSFGSCSIDGYPTVYTRVDGYTDWIVSKLKA